MESEKNTFYQLWVYAGFAFAIYLLHVFLFSSWIIDDAGIMFTYARNISHGSGIVAQPGLQPVEGCTDFLWVLLFVPFFWMKIFDPVITPKVFSALIILSLYLISFRQLRHYFPPLLVFIFLLLLSVSTPFAIWTNSGLENPLYILLIALLFFNSFRLKEGKPGQWILSAVLLFLISLTRPDGVLYGAAPVAACAWLLLFSESGEERMKHFRLASLYVVLFGVLYLLFLLFRRSYFGEWVPNTYYYKVGASAGDLFTSVFAGRSPGEKFMKLVQLLGHANNLYLIVILLILNVWGWMKKIFGETHFFITVFCSLGMANFILLPYDWMPEFRFATPYIFFFYLFVISTLYHVSLHFRIQVWYPAALLVGMGVIWGTGFYKRSTVFADAPLVPFTGVGNYLGHMFNEFAEVLEVRNASLLTPDCGGTLYYSKLRIYDMAGLVDKRYALTTMGRNSSAFNRLVFETDKPTFIEIHTNWSSAIRLQADPRFYETYIPVHEDTVWYDKTALNGIYVRKSEAGDKLEALKKLYHEKYRKELYF